MSQKSNLELISSESEHSEEEIIDINDPKGKIIRASHNSSSWWDITTLKLYL